MWSAGLSLILTLISAFVKNRELRKKLAKQVTEFIEKRDTRAVERVRRNKKWAKVIDEAMANSDH